MGIVSECRSEGRLLFQEFDREFCETNPDYCSGEVHEKNTETGALLGSDGWYRSWYTDSEGNQTIAIQKTVLISRGKFYLRVTDEAGDYSLQVYDLGGAMLIQADANDCTDITITHQGDVTNAESLLNSALNYVTCATYMINGHAFKNPSSRSM